jgi:hypothetical protein
MNRSRHLASPMRTTRNRSTADRVISAGLATAACAGLIGVIGIRSMEQSAAAPSDTTATVDASAPVVSSAGLTEAQLDSYAAQLQQESTKLDAYRAKLVKAAKQLTASATTAAAPSAASAPAKATKPTATAKAKPRPVVKPAPKPVAKPAPKPAPKPAAKPQSSTKSS